MKAILLKQNLLRSFILLVSLFSAPALHASNECSAALFRTSPVNSKFEAVFQSEGTLNALEEFQATPAYHAQKVNHPRAIELVTTVLESLNQSLSVLELRALFINTLGPNVVRHDLFISQEMNRLNPDNISAFHVANTMNYRAVNLGENMATTFVNALLSMRQMTPEQRSAQLKVDYRRLVASENIQSIIDKLEFGDERKRFEAQYEALNLVIPIFYRPRAMRHKLLVQILGQQNPDLANLQILGRESTFVDYLLTGLNTLHPGKNGNQGTIDFLKKIQAFKFD